MNSAIRTDEKRVSESKPESDAGFHRLAENMISTTPNKKSSGKGGYQQFQNPDKVIQKSSDAIMKTLIKNQDKWLKHIKNTEKNQSWTITKQIKNMLDPQDTGNIPFNIFFDFLIEIGVPLKPKIVKFTLAKLLKTENVCNKVIKEEHISNLCRGDNRSNQILNVLNRIISRTSNKSFEEVTSAEHKLLINSWWKKLDSLRSNQVMCNKVCEFLIEVEICSNFPESKKYVCKVTQNLVFMDSDQFKALFAKAVITHALINLNRKFTEEDWNNPVYSYAYKLCQLKRQMILAGIQYPIQNISIEEGEILIKAIKEFAKYKGEDEVKITYEDFKMRWLQHTGHVLDSMPKNVMSIQSQASEVELAEYFPKNGDVMDKELEWHRMATMRESKKKEQLQKRFTQNFDIIKKTDHCGFDKFRDSPFKRVNKPVTDYEKKCEKFNMLFDEFQKVVNKVT